MSAVTKCSASDNSLIRNKNLINKQVPQTTLKTDTKGKFSLGSGSRTVEVPKKQISAEQYKNLGIQAKKVADCISTLLSTNLTEERELAAEYCINILLEEITRAGFTTSTNFLPQIKYLDERLSNLQGDLHGVMSDALDPKSTIDLDFLKKKLQVQRSRFEELRKNIEKQVEPVKARSLALDKVIEATKEHMASVWISKVVCDWELSRIDIFANTLSNLHVLQKEIVGLYQDVENLKKYLRDNPFQPIDMVKYAVTSTLLDQSDKDLKDVLPTLLQLVTEYPDSAPEQPLSDLKELINGSEIKLTEASLSIAKVLDQLPQSTLDVVQLEYATIVKRYNECLSIARDLRLGANNEIRSLRTLIEDKESELKKSVAEIPFHDDLVKLNVQKHLDRSLDGIQQEREVLLDKLEKCWEKISSELNIDESNHLYYDVNRLGYAIFEYSGKIPYDTTYNRMIGGWSITTRYVEPLVVSESSSSSTN